jgi:hypothetical protein
MRPNLILTYSFILSSFLFLLTACAGSSGLTLQDRRKTAEVFFKKGIKSKAQHDNNNALHYFRKSIKVDSLFTDAYAETAEILIDDGDDRGAESLLSLAPAKLKSEARILRLLGKAQFNQRKINEAISNIEMSMKAEPADRNAAWLIAQLYYQLENYELASAHIEPLLKDSLVPDYEKIFSLYQKIDLILSALNPVAFFEKHRIQNIRQSSKVTRGQFALLLCHEFKTWNADMDSDIVFDDVDAGDSSLIYYKRAIVSQVFERLPDGKFYPEYTIKRRNLAHYLYCIIKIKNGDLISANKILLNNVTQDDLQFDEIQAVCELKLMVLREDGRFGPDEPVTGAELTGALHTLKTLLNIR